MFGVHSRVSRRVGLRVVLGLAAFVTVVGQPHPAQAQADRYELGRRLRAFEGRWEQPAEPDARRRAAKALDDSVKDFFRFQFDEAARAMTRAFRLLDGWLAIPEAIRWADSLAIHPSPRLIERGATTLDATVSPVYPVEVEAPDEAIARISVAIDGEEADRTLLEFELEEGAQRIAIPIANLPEGDHRLMLDVIVSGRNVSQSRSVLSVVDRLADRLEAAQTTLDTWTNTDPGVTTDSATARQSLQILTNLADGGVSETDIDAWALMTELEALLASWGHGVPHHGPDRPGSFRMTLVAPEGRLIPARVFVPETIAEGTPTPLVVALHGMGGSENLFFDGYGRGAVVEHCRKRGWLLISPRRGPIGSGPIEEVVEAMASLYPVDRSQVFLVGHSSGAAQAIEAVARHPDRYAGVSALGGGGRIAEEPDLTRVPMFIGVGELDFMRESSRKLRDELSRIGSDRVEYREYPDIEHLVIVQVALPDTFDFFDRIEENLLDEDR
jgi:predicted esterase